MRLVVFRSLLVLTAGAAVLIAVLYVASTVDARSPEVLEFALTQPLPADPDTALITTSLEIVFNEPVQVDSGTAALVVAPRVEGSESWSGSTLIYTPDEPLELDTTYVVTLGAGIRDAAGNRIGAPAPTFTFTTAGRPEIVSTDPQDGAADVPVDEPIRITFSTLMDTGSVGSALRLEPEFDRQLRWSGETLEIVPVRALDPGSEYSVRIGTGAADVAGVPLREGLRLTIRTVPGGLEASELVPAEGVDGVAPASTIAVIFGEAIDPTSVSADVLTIEPEVAGSLAVVSVSGEPVPDEDRDAGRVLLFTPSGPLPLNTTFDVSLAAGLRSMAGARLAEPVGWSFTTGAPAATLSNQITFVSDRGGVANVWAMNPDGSGQHQVSTELSPVVDYAVAPDGGALVVADGRRLVRMRADGSDRNVLTQEGVLEFDPTFAPNGQQIAFGRADAATGDGMGLWLRSVDGGEASPIERPGAGGEPARDGWLRAPRFSPDGEALAFVDLDGSVGVLELVADTEARAEATPMGPPAWLPDSSGIVITHLPRGVGLEPPSPGGLVLPLGEPPWDALAVGAMDRSGGRLRPTAWPAAALVGVDAEGGLAYLDEEARLHLAPATDERGAIAPGVGDAIVLEGAFAPGGEAMAIVVVGELRPGPLRGEVQVLDLETGARTVLAPDGELVRWLP